MQYQVSVDEVIGGFRVAIDIVVDQHMKEPVAWCAHRHQVPQRMKELFEGLYRKPEPKGKKADKT